MLTPRTGSCVQSCMRCGARSSVELEQTHSHLMPHNNQNNSHQNYNNNSQNSRNSKQCNNKNTKTTTMYITTPAATALAAPPSWAASPTAAPLAACASCVCVKPVASTMLWTGCALCATSNCKCLSLSLCLCLYLYYFLFHSLYLCHFLFQQPPLSVLKSYILHITRILSTPTLICICGGHGYNNMHTYNGP